MGEKPTSTALDEPTEAIYMTTLKYVKPLELLVCMCVLTIPVWQCGTKQEGGQVTGRQYQVGWGQVSGGSGTKRRTHLIPQLTLHFLQHCGWPHFAFTSTLKPRQLLTLLQCVINIYFPLTRVNIQSITLEVHGGKVQKAF